MKHHIFFACFLYGLVLLVQSCQRSTVEQPIAVIWDTDIGPDFDDAGAAAMLHHLADSGRIKLLATIASNRYAHTRGVLQVFNTWYGRPQLPIGVPDSLNVPDVPDYCHWTDSLIQHFASHVLPQSAVQPAVALYRRLLASAPDQGVVIISTGFFTNLAALLQSPPDRYARDSGIALVGRKVKYLVSMAGAFPAGKEFNIYNDPRAAIYVAEHWPTPVIFSGFEIGDSVFTGLALLQDTAEQKSPLRLAFQVGIHCLHENAIGHPSWDETAVLAAIDTSHELFDWHPGHILIQADGSNSWEEKHAGQYYLLPKVSREQLASRINAYLH
ncbi:MAG: nucleoside hydrolase [Thermoflavifilum sp.]|nr:nucleoside hydrolase [Thermoflavifilum sp.]